MRRWDVWVICVALSGVGVGLTLSAMIGQLDVPWASVAATATLWLGMVVAIVFAFTRGHPAGVITFRPVDLLWGASAGLGLRLFQGWSSGASVSAFPHIATLDGGLPSGWWLTTAVPAVFVAPVVEELFFRVVILIAVYQIFRRSVGPVSAGVTALLTSVGGFVLLHAPSGSPTLIDALGLFAVGAVCAVIVLLTGRVWGALIAHVVYNATYIVLVLLGTYLQ